VHIFQRSATIAHHLFFFQLASLSALMSLNPTMRKNAQITRWGLHYPDSAACSRRS